MTVNLNVGLTAAEGYIIKVLLYIDLTDDQTTIIVDRVQIHQVTYLVCCSLNMPIRHNVQWWMASEVLNLSMEAITHMARADQCYRNQSHRFNLGLLFRSTLTKHQ